MGVTGWVSAQAMVRVFEAVPAGQQPAAPGGQLPWAAGTHRAVAGRRPPPLRETAAAFDADREPELLEEARTLAEKVQTSPDQSPASMEPLT